MLDIETIQRPTTDGLSIVTLEEMKKHLRILHGNLDEQIQAAVREAAAGLHGGAFGMLNRTVFPCTLVRYLPAFPATGVIKLPFPPLIRVEDIRYLGEGGEDASPLPTVPKGHYITRTIDQIPQIKLLPGRSWPSVIAHPRAVQVVYKAGYEAFTGPSTGQEEQLIRRLVKILAAHNVENTEATINEQRQTTTNREVDFGVAMIVNQLRVIPSYDDWV